MPTMTINVPKQPIYQQYYVVDTNTKNASFLQMYYYLINIGIPKNRADFMLRAYDASVVGLDPFDPKLTMQQKSRIAIECGRNIWYFARECVRISTPAGKIRYGLHRGNMAMMYLFEHNMSQFVEMPRQFGKTIGANVCYLWVFNFASRNSEILYYHKDHTGSKSNLKTMKEIRDNLPEYLQMKPESFGQNGQKIKVRNTIETATAPITNNHILTLPSARSKEQADKIARGRTSTFIYFDEFAFMPYNQEVYTAAIPAYSTASMLAKQAHAHYGVIITTTPGDLTTEAGQYAYTVRNNATAWNDQYYGLSDSQLTELSNSNENSMFFLITFNYKQLGRGNDYLKRMVIELNRDWPKIRREVLLEWAQTSDNNPFTKEQLEQIENYCRDPIRVLLFGRVNQYQVNVYEDIDMSYPPIIGVDVSGAMMQDSSTITIIDSKTTRVIADFNSNHIPADDLADLIYTLITKFYPNACCTIERNGGFGSTVLQRLCRTSIKKNLYFEIKDKVIEETFNGIRVNPRKARVKVYGTDSTKEVRARMIELLYDRVENHKDKFVSKLLLNELKTLEVTKSGRVEAVAAHHHHDDQVFSYLHAIRVWYDGANLAENYGIKKNTIKTDDNVELEENSLEKDEDYKAIDIETIHDPDKDDEEAMVRDQYIAQASNNISMSDLNKVVYDSEESDFNNYMNLNHYAREAYNKKYNIDGESASNFGINNVSIPDSFFGAASADDEDTYYQQNMKKLHGNLWDKYKQL